MSICTRSIWTVLAVTLLPQLATAGPIEWSYHTEVTYNQDYGSNFTVSLQPNGTVSTLPGDQSFVWLFYSTGVARPEPGSHERTYEFTVAVTVTDLASGAAHTMNIGGWYSSQWSYPPEEANNPDAWRWDYEGSGFGDFWGGSGVILGKNHYTIRGYGGASGSFPFGELAVEIHPTAATPEPSTIALAGLSLAGVGLFRTRRRAVTVSTPVV